MSVIRMSQPGKTRKQTTNGYNADAKDNSANLIATTTYVAGAGAKNAYTGVPGVGVSGTTGSLFVFTSGAATNDAASTLDLGFGAKPIVTNANAALAGGEVVNGSTYVLVYDGTSFRIL